MVHCSLINTYWILMKCNRKCFDASLGKAGCCDLDPVPGSANRTNTYDVPLARNMTGIFSIHYDA